MQQWKAIIPLPSSLADSNTSSETDRDDYEDSDYSESQQPHPTEKSRDHWDVPDDGDKELTRKKPSRVCCTISQRYPNYSDEVL